jgi:signal transduction histidine kinase/CheY-like chemotaxis protein/predicted hydrocarbon binding protein
MAIVEELNTVSVPASMREPFLRAQEYVERFFHDRLLDPSHSTIAISGERYILVRAAAMSVEFFDLVTSLYADRGPQEARLVAANLLFDIAHSIGRGDARTFHERMKVTDPIERLSAGPIHFSFSGWAFVKILPESAPSPDENYYLIYEHPFSFESDAWIKRGRKSEYPVCIMSAGYSSGWCEESFGLPLVAAEVECLARGDAQCRFIMSPPSHIEGHLARYMSSPERPARPHWPARPTPVAIPEFFQRKRLEAEVRTARERLEHRVLERTEQLASANAALQAEMAERIRAEQERVLLRDQMQQSQRLESLGVLASGVAHDFNSLLVGVLGNAELGLSYADSGSPEAHAFERIKRSAERAAELTRSMLSTVGRGRFDMKRVNLSQLVGELRPLLPATQADLKAGLPEIEADPAQVRQIVRNLVTNAFEAMGGAQGEAGGEIHVTTGVVEAPAPLAPGQYVFVEVADNGPGIDEATRERMFEPFFSTKATGRGLGLAVVQGIVRGHHGTIQLTTEPGKGSTFRVLLPCPEVEQHPLPQQEEPAKSMGTVLLVDDEEAVLEVAQAMLERAGFGVVTAAGGRQAIEMLRAARTFRDEPLVAMVVDLNMKDLNGAETMEEVERLWPGLPVILTSGYNEQDAHVKFGLKAKTPFLQKPFSAAALVAAVKDALCANLSRAV